MSLLLALILAQGAAQPAVPPEEPELVVMHRKLNNWRGEWKLKKGKILCKTTRTTGDKAIDAVGCQAMTTCIAPHLGEITAISASKDSQTIKNKAMADLMTGLLPCFEAEREKGLQALADRRASQ